MRKFLLNYVGLQYVRLLSAVQIENLQIAVCFS